ncbi:MAG: carboxypeptidase regulatory-like domain-containing protein [Saprospiraceae bacterium]
MKKILLFFVLSCVSITSILAQTSLEGQVTDAGSGEAILFGTIALYKNDVLLTGVETDLEGNYFFSDMDPGTYDIEASYIGYTAQKQVGVIIKAGQSNRLDFTISEGVLIDAVEIVEYKVPLIEFDYTTSGAVVTAKDIRSLPTKSINAIAATTAGIASTDGGAISIRGSRSDATVYYIDGVRVSGLIPQSEIDQMQVITGGVEAKYGDLVGGAISLTSKGPSSKFSGGVEVETSEFLDGYGYNLVAANLSGPILKNSNNQSILGYRFAGQYRSVDDNFPSAGGVYAASEELIDQLEKDPVITIGTSEFPSLEDISDVGAPLKARPNENRTDYNFTGKIDAKIASNMDLSISGTFDNAVDQFTPGGASWRLLNWRRNPFNYTNGYRANVRFKHKLGGQGVLDADATDEEKAANVSSLRNLYYTIQGSFERRNSRTEDPIHKESVFNYGYFGKTDREWEVNLGTILDLDSYQGDTTNLVEVFPGVFQGHVGYEEVEGEFTANTEINPTLSKYNDVNGFLETNTSNAWGLFNNVGRVYNRLSKGENDILSLNVTSGFDFLPGGSSKGRHSIQFGFLYEQRTNRFWNVAPRGLWDLARVSVNNHISGIDGDKIVGQDSIRYFFQNVPQIGYVNVYAPAITIDNDNKFFREVRNLVGAGLDDYVNIDDIDPTKLRLDMFSAAELNDASLINYYGYDYLGNKLSGNIQFDDFFTSEDKDGVRTFVNPAFKPIYGAAYIQDKFSFRDIIFRVGVRMDYYDANTKVLKDPYSLYEIESAKEFFGRTSQTQPETVNDEYKVYVTGEGSNSVVGYRQGDNWFAPDGSGVSGGNILFGGGLVNPSIKDPSAPSIKRRGFDTNRSFKDYEPQLNFMPRLAFSFPISDDAGFFAHYDVLYQRPTSNTIQSPVGYYYFEKAGGDLFNNPDLKPVRTVDYEVGFQKKLTNSTAIKMSAYYKEQKDLIQSRVFANLPAPVNSYESYGNLDFGTTKGFSFSFDKRRVNNLKLSATYTLQFADGSGSDANSSRGINSRGIIRNLIPLSFDERHRLTAVIDYGYEGGKNYTGPTIAGKNIFANAGINFNLAAVSGRPFTRRDVVRQFGGDGYRGAINGSRLPWTYNVDMRLDKRFSLSYNADKNKALNFTVYLRVANLFDIRNVRNVFSFTGDPEDDGYIISSFGKDQLSSINDQNRNEEAFLAAYNWRLDSFSNFTLPRRIFMGVNIDF